MVKLFNTLTRKIEVFKPVKSGEVGMYTCGMTVYDHTHIGHMRTYVNTDLLRRALEYNGFKVKQVENVTDVGHLTSDSDTGEDKLAKKAKLERKTAWEIAKIYTKEYLEVMKELNILPPHILCPATEHIKEMIQLVQRLEKKGYTYIITGDGVYFDTAKLSDYGKLAHMPRDKILAGVRVEVVPGKKNPTDFALWKFTPAGQKRDMEWESPWGIGFPGWHIECSAMSMKYLGETFDPFGKLRVNGSTMLTIDIHTGGIDHILIHHTNEIAQAEAATGKPFVKYWFHNEFMMVEGKKMSKSLGNYFWIEDVKNRGFEPLSLRYLFLTTHYRSKMNFTWKSLEGAQRALNKLREQVAEWGEAKIGCAEYEEKFLTAINNDLDMPRALAMVWDLLKSKYPDSAKKATLLKFDQVLGLRLEKVSREARVSRVPREVRELVEKREKLRKEEKWEEADEIRKQIEKSGFVVGDTPTGPKIKEKSHFK